MYSTNIISDSNRYLPDNKNDVISNEQEIQSMERTVRLEKKLDLALDLLNRILGENQELKDRVDCIENLLDKVSNITDESVNMLMCQEDIYNVNSPVFRKMLYFVLLQIGHANKAEIIHNYFIDKQIRLSVCKNSYEFFDKHLRDLFSMMTSEEYIRVMSEEDLYRSEYLRHDYYSKGSKESKFDKLINLGILCNSKEFTIICQEAYDRIIDAQIDFTENTWGIVKQ